MSARNLLSDPCWQASDLGLPLPDAPHAVSVALPRWQDVIAYEETIPPAVTHFRPSIRALACIHC